jgi:hypothetical protein
LKERDKGGRPWEEQFMTNWIAILQALLTPTIGVIAAYVAWQQYRLAKQKHDIDIFNRRMQVYKITIAFLVKCEKTYSISEDDYYEWLRDVADAEFLFGKEILDFLADIEDTAADIVFQERDDPMIKRNKKGGIVSINFEVANQFNKFLDFRGRASLLFSPYFQAFLKVDRSRKKFEYDEILKQEERDMEKARQDFTPSSATDDDIPF